MAEAAQKRSAAAALLKQMWPSAPAELELLRVALEFDREDAWGSARLTTLLLTATTDVAAKWAVDRFRSRSSDGNAESSRTRVSAMVERARTSFFAGR